MSNSTENTNMVHVSTTDMILDYRAMEQMNTLANLMAGGKATVPVHLQGNPADCMAIIMQAAQWRMNPFAVAQKTHVINGTLGYEAQLVNAVISSSKAINGRFHYDSGGDWEVTGDGSNQKIQPGVNVNNGNTITQNCWVQVGAILSGDDKIQWGERLYPSMVTTKNSPLWKTNPKQQAKYLALKYWARLYVPAVILGVYSSDEFDEPEANKPTERVINPSESKGDSEEPAEVVKDAYTQKQFLANANEWANLIQAGKATPQKIIKRISTVNFVPEEIIEQINNLTHELTQEQTA
jgi:hypothetical protein